MIGIYQDNFVDFLKKNLGDCKTTQKNIITVCPWCEYGKKKDHYHLHISLDLPIFHCFHGSCEQKGTIGKLISKIQGNDISDIFVDKNKLKESNKKREIFVNKEIISKDIIIPPLNREKFLSKELYLKKRLKFFNINSSSIKGLIYDFNEFLNINHIHLQQNVAKLKDYLQNNFIGFLTENESTIIFRNIDSSQKMRYYKYKIKETNFLDYYRLNGSDITSNTIVLAEGIFDIFSSYLFDNLNIKNKVRLYASALSAKYQALIHSLVFYENIYRPDIIILSDRGIDIEYYKKLKLKNCHIINSLSVYYNKSGKDFNDLPVDPVKIQL